MVKNITTVSTKFTSLFSYLVPFTRKTDANFKFLLKLCFLDFSNFGKIQKILLEHILTFKLVVDSRYEQDKKLKFFLIYSDMRNVSVTEALQHLY